jgi:predicted nucleic acid-binding protein
MNAAGPARNSTAVAFLVDTNILVYRFDPRFPDKQATERDLLRKGLAEDSARIPHQALLEFVSVVTRVRAGSNPLLAPDEARHETEELMAQFPMLFPNAALLRTALQGAAAYQFSWFDAHLWAYAEHYGLEEIVSEDFEHGRLYGNVRIRNPFRRR